MTHTHKSIKCQTCECADSTELGSNKRDASQVGKLKPEKKEKSQEYLSVPDSKNVQVIWSKCTWHEINFFMNMHLSKKWSIFIHFMYEIKKWQFKQKNRFVWNSLENDRAKKNITTL